MLILSAIILLPPPPLPHRHSEEAKEEGQKQKGKERGGHGRSSKELKGTCTQLTAQAKEGSEEGRKKNPPSINYETPSCFWRGSSKKEAFVAVCTISSSRKGKLT